MVQDSKILTTLSQGCTHSNACHCDCSVHLSPFGGHSGIKRTHYRIASRFYGPGMVHNTTEDIQGYCYCQLANQASHYVQVELQTLAGDAPF